VHVELLGQFGQRLLALHGSQGHLRLEGWGVVPARSSRHRLSLPAAILAAVRQKLHSSRLSRFPGPALVLFDAVAYQFLPPEIAAGFHPYRCPACVPPPAVPGGGTALRDYYVADPERGFDIAPNRPSTPHYVDGTLYPVWSNSLGCFDVEPEIADRYVYLAGDSFAWGFTPFEDKLGTVLERRLGVPVLKCGVSGAGELHELAKMRHVIAAAGKKPALIIDAYFANDVQDDLAYPSATVVDGWLATKVLVAERDGRYELRPRSQADLEAAAAAIPAPKSDPSTASGTPCRS